MPTATPPIFRREEEGGGVEIGDGTGEAADDGNAALIRHYVDDAVEVFAADVVDGERDAVWPEGGFEFIAPIWVGGIVNPIGSKCL